MGTIISLMKPKTEIPLAVEFNEADIENIKRTWEIPRSVPLDAGETILLKYFEAYPHYQNKFEHFKNTPLLILKGAPGFRTHAGRIMKVFDDTIQALGNEDYEQDLKIIWEMTGRNHFRRKIPMKAFVDIRGIILAVLMEVCNLTADECESWNKFFDNVYHTMFSTMAALAFDEKRRK